MRHQSMIIQQFFSSTYSQVLKLTSPVEVPEHSGKHEFLVGLIVNYQSEQRLYRYPNGSTCTYTVIPSFKFVHRWNMQKWQTADSTDKAQYEMQIPFESLSAIGFAPVYVSYGRWPR